MLYLILAETGGKKRGLPAPPLFSTNTNFALYNSFSAYSCINTYEDERAFELDENGIVAGFNCAGEPEGQTPWNDPAFQYFRVLPFWHYTE